ncbi:kinase-like domain-containing protein [Tuber borchii]|uniref:Kinase-like domain-containing protein n=1 Tax=Tuber borchii TaxID=42251 RepID=A0A2T6ZME7_TUBBO|nr:kinase-like domain-containing protein [Tuber borchii]
MAAAGSAFGIVGALDVCFRTGQNLRERYRDIRNAGRDVEDLNIRVENVWLHIAYQLSTVQSSGDEVPPVLRDHIEVLLDKLVFCLHTACKNIDRVTDNTGKTKALKFALFIKGSLEKDVTALEKWRDMFRSTFYMMSIPKNPALDRILSMEVQKNAPPVGSAVANVKAIRDVYADDPTKQFSSVWLPPVRMYFPNPIGYSGSHIVLDENTHTKYVMETITVDQGRKDYGQLDRDVTKLARVLRESKNVPGILTCKGVVKKVGVNGQPEEFQFILEMPHGLGDTPSCLRSVLHRSAHEPHPLEERVLLARQIASAVIFVHNLNFVHKNMRPDTILVFPNPGKTLGTPFLAGFQMFRSADGFSYRSGDDSWSKNLYRHPSRQGTHPDNIYRMQHDIYSLGVILLEVGLWSPFVNQAGYPGEALSQIVPILQDRDQRKGSTRIKKQLVSMASNLLPPRMGTKYADVVVACLTCLDKNSELGTEGEFLEDDGILVGVRFIQHVLGVLEDIVV